MSLQQKVLVIKQIVALIVNNDQVGGAQDDQVDSLERWDHHLIHRTGYQHQQHAVGEVLKYPAMKGAQHFN